MNISYNVKIIPKVFYIFSIFFPDVSTKSVPSHHGPDRNTTCKLLFNFYIHATEHTCGSVLALFPTIIYFDRKCGKLFSHLRISKESGQPKAPVILFFANRATDTLSNSWIFFSAIKNCIWGPYESPG